MIRRARLALPLSTVALILALGTPGAAAQGQQDEPVFSLPPVEVTSPWIPVPPRLEQAPKPPYPEGARARGEQGTVLILIRVRPDGTVGDVKLRKSSGTTALDEAAVKGARAWTFVPARRGPNPIEAWVEVPVQFKLQ